MAAGAAEEEEEEEDLDEALLDALLDDLEAAPPAPASEAAATAAPVVFGAAARSIGHGLVHWPVEVRLCVAAFLPWRDLLADARLCRAWRDLERHDVLWRTPFFAMWPRLALRKETREHGAEGEPVAGPLWRVLFRARWASREGPEDALEEDWLDLKAATELSAETASRDGTKASKEAAARIALEAELCVALSRCRQKVLQTGGARIPGAVDEAHVCGAPCKYHRLSIDGDAFVCERSGRVHHCKAREPCDGCVVSSDACFLICCVSGRCYPNREVLQAEEAREEEGGHDWDPELSATQQLERWFEQGYNMSEEQADELNGPDDPRRRRRSCIIR